MAGAPQLRWARRNDVCRKDLLCVAPSFQSANRAASMLFLAISFLRESLGNQKPVGNGGFRVSSAKPEQALL